DVGIAIPIVSVQMDATVDSEILRTGSGTTVLPLTHSFDPSGAGTASFSESGSATGFGDVLLRAKYNFLRTSTSALAAALDLRLPTGDEDELLGTGATQTKLLFVASGEYGRFSPHVNFGYTFSNGETSEEATSFDLDPAQFALNTIPGGFVPNEIDLSVPDEVNYTLGFSVAATSRVTVGFDMYGRTFQDVARFAPENNVYPNRAGSGPLPVGSVPVNNEFSVESRSGNLNIVLGVVGGKINLGSTFLLNVTVLFQMNDAGLKPKPTPVIGFDYVF
ncbi:MAG TPA: transporter, partial [Vicinamibacterales bacterium]|nr:transporter [Vicinamibacterales bacterium]